MQQINNIFFFNFQSPLHRIGRRSRSPSPQRIESSIHRIGRRSRTPSPTMLAAHRIDDLRDEVSDESTKKNLIVNSVDLQASLGKTYLKKFPSNCIDHASGADPERGQGPFSPQNKTFFFKISPFFTMFCLQTSNSWIRPSHAYVFRFHQVVAPDTHMYPKRLEVHCRYVGSLLIFLFV